MSWAGSSSAHSSPSVARKPTAGVHSHTNSAMALASAASSSQLAGSASSAATSSAATASGTGTTTTSDEDTVAGPVRTTDQASGDLVVPLVIWNEPPRVRIACLHVLYLPMAQPSQNSNDLMNRWPSLASVVQQWSSSQQLTGSSGSLASLTGLGNSAHSMINLRRVLSRHKSKRASLTPDERLAAKQSAASDTSGDFMDDEDFQYVDDGDLDGDDELYQLCVFAGTTDGNIVYWLFEQDVVVQVSMLVHPTAASMAADYQDELAFGGSTQSQAATPVVGIVSGIDEWGQSNMISVSQDGAIARWELPNGACSRADVNLARQLAPVKGLKMFCNNRYAIVYGEQSRMMVLDTWKLVLLYCVDTAQEQVRRGVAVVELKMSNARKTVSTSLAGTESSGRRVSDVTGIGEITGSSLSNFVGVSGYSPSSGSSASTSNLQTVISNGGSPSIGSRTQRPVTSHIWDSLVLSLGSEGLIKCFLWSKPRGGGSSATTVGNGAMASSFQWIQESCWVISWADDADDITCSQSTSLKDGDNMNPQTALMRSIKSSYFPRCLHISGDASLLLIIWDTKWVILKRKWLCDLSPPGTTTDVRTTGRSASWKDTSSTSNKSKQSKHVGSCRIHPAIFVERQFPKQENNDGARKTEDNQVWWEDGAFLNDNQVVLWTNTGHVFQFPVSGSAFSQAGKLFMFTKDQDQLVPRSFHKALNVVDKAEFVAFVHQCECCHGNNYVGRRYDTENLRDRIRVNVETNQQQGYTNCVFAADGSGASRSLLSTSSGGVKLVHMCARGSVGSWTLSPGKSPGSAPPSPTRRSAICSSVGSYERVKLHSISDGYVRDQSQVNAPSCDSDTKIEDNGRAIITHLILGREGARSSSYLGESQAARQGRRRKRTAKPASSADSAGASVGSIVGASNMIASALSPVSALLPTSIRRQRRSSIGGGAVFSEDVYSDFLLDVPVVVRGCSDGFLDFRLLSSSRPASQVNNSCDSVRLKCHREKVRAIAHCYWPTVPTGLQSKDTSCGPPTITRATTTGSASETVKSGVYMSARKALVTKRGAPIEDSCLASDKNPFFRARFPPSVQRRSASSRHLSLHHQTPLQSALVSNAPAAPTKATTTTAEPSSGFLNFVVFSGCADGGLCISELSLHSTEDSTFVVDATQLQRFKKHRGAVKEVLVSPWTRENSVCPERYVATIGEDNTVNVYAPVYLQNPYSYGAASSTPTSVPSNGRPSRIGIEWECVMEFCEHPDAILSLEWHTERGQIFVECADDIVYVWNLDTGALERSVPAAVVYGGGNMKMDEEIGTESADNDSSVECSKLVVGDTSLHLIKFNVNKSAEVIKTNWKAYYFGQLSGDVPSMSESGDVMKPRLPFSSPYAVGSIELLLLAFLLSWGASPDIDRACRQLLGLDSPHSLFSCILLDESSGALSIPLPWKSVFSPMSSEQGEDRNPFARKWQHSSALSANIALGIVSLCMNLMEHKYTKTEDGFDQSTPSSPKNKEEFHVLWSQLITQHSVVLPDYVPFFREPSLEFLANYGFHKCEYTQLAARALMNSAIKRLHPPTRSALSAEYSAKLHCEIVRVETETGGKLNGTSSSNTIDTGLTVNRLGSLVILLSMIGTCYPGEISPAGAREVCDILVSLLRSPVQHVASVAAELLTKGLMLFRPHLVDLSSLITQLLFIDLREKQRNPGGDSPTFGSNARVLASGGSNAALSLLVELGACETAFVLTLLQHEMNNADRPHAFRECILLYLTELINTHYLLMFRHLPSVIDTIMHCLDPTKPERRKRCLELSTRCLHNLVRRFPMVDFHKETQRLAIGTMEAVILIYDLRTATKWRVLDGHSSAISAVSFRADGQILVSYAAREGSVRWWNSGNAGLFGGMLKLQQSCIKEHKLDVLKSFANAPLSSGGASGDLKQVIQTCKFQFLVLKEGPNNQQGPAGSTGERKVLRLTREDASQVQFLM